MSPDHLLSLLSACCDALIDRADDVSERFPGRTTEAHDLANLIERCMCHGLLGRTTFFGTELGLWGVLEGASGQSAEFKKALTLSKATRAQTPHGKARAWIRISLAQSRLSDHVAFLHYHDDIRSFYVPGGLLLTPRTANELLRQINRVRTKVKFQLPLKGDELDITGTPPGGSDWRSYKDSPQTAVDALLRITRASPSTVSVPTPPKPIPEAAPPEPSPPCDDAHRSAELAALRRLVAEAASHRNKTDKALESLQRERQILQQRIEEMEIQVTAEQHEKLRAQLEEAEDAEESSLARAIIAEEENTQLKADVEAAHQLAASMTAESMTVAEETKQINQQLQKQLAEAESEIGRLTSALHNAEHSIAELSEARTHEVGQATAVAAEGGAAAMAALAKALEAVESVRVERDEAIDRNKDLTNELGLVRKQLGEAGDREEAAMKAARSGQSLAAQSSADAVVQKRRADQAIEDLKRVQAELEDARGMAETTVQQIWAGAATAAEERERLRLMIARAKGDRADAKAVADQALDEAVAANIQMASALRLAATSQMARSVAIGSSSEALVSMYKEGPLPLWALSSRCLIERTRQATAPIDSTTLNRVELLKAALGHAEVDSVDLRAQVKELEMRVIESEAQCLTAQREAEAARTELKRVLGGEGNRPRTQSARKVVSALLLRVSNPMRSVSKLMKFEASSSVGQVKLELTRRGIVPDWNGCVLVLKRGGGSSALCDDEAVPLSSFDISEKDDVIAIESA